MTQTVSWSLQSTSAEKQNTFGLGKIQKVQLDQLDQLDQGIYKLDQGIYKLDQGIIN